MLSLTMRPPNDVQYPGSARNGNERHSELPGAQGRQQRVVEEELQRAHHEGRRAIAYIGNPAPARALYAKNVPGDDEYTKRVAGENPLRRCELLVTCGDH